MRIPAIQASPICVYWSKDGDNGHELYFHADHPSYSFDEFCFHVILPHLKGLRRRGFGVHWGYVNDGNQTVDEFECSLLRLMELDNENE